MLSVTMFGTCCRKTMRPVSTTRLWTYTPTVATHTIVRDSQRMLYQRPDTGINTILSPESPARPNGGNDGIASVARKEKNKAPLENSPHV
jgi:hypothetical protein